MRRLHLLHELSELVQWSSHDDGTINIVTSIFIIITLFVTLEILSGFQITTLLIVYKNLTEHFHPIFMSVSTLFWT